MVALQHSTTMEAAMDEQLAKHHHTDQTHLNCMCPSRESISFSLKTAADLNRLPWRLQIECHLHSRDSYSRPPVDLAISGWHLHSSVLTAHDCLIYYAYSRHHRSAEYGALAVVVHRSCYRRVNLAIRYPIGQRLEHNRHYYQCLNPL